MQGLRILPPCNGECTGKELENEMETGSMWGLRGFIEVIVNTSLIKDP